MSLSVENNIFSSISELVGSFENAAVRAKSVEVGPGVLVRFVVEQFQPYRVMVQMETHEDGIRVFTARLGIYPAVKVACTLHIEQLGVEVRAAQSAGGWDNQAYREINRYMSSWFDECVKGRHIEALKACAARRVTV